MEAEMQTESYFVLQIKWPYLLTDSKQTYIILGNTWNVWGINFQENPANVTRMQQKSYFVLLGKNHLLCTDRNQTY